MAFFLSNRIQKLEHENRWSEAAELYMSEGIKRRQCNRLSESAVSYIKAAESFKKHGKLDEAVAAWHLARVTWKELGPSSNALAAICSGNIGKLEREQGNHDRSIQAFEEASLLFGELKPELSLQSKIAAANLAMTSSIHMIKKAVDMYEDIARKISKTAAGDVMTVRLFLFRAALCRVLGASYGNLDTLVNCEYAKLDPGFKSSMEFRIIENLYLSLDMGDKEGFYDAAVDCAKRFGKREMTVRNLLNDCYSELAAI